MSGVDQLLCYRLEGGSHAETCLGFCWDVPVHFGELRKLFDFYRLLFLTNLDLTFFPFRSLFLIFIFLLIHLFIVFLNWLVNAEKLE